jgi:serine/threonine-protein kinase HipA
MSEETTEVIRLAEVYQSGTLAGYLQEQLDRSWVFAYEGNYEGIPVSLTLPFRREPYSFKEFPPVFEGLLPEGPQLEALLRTHKIDRHDAFTQLLAVGEDLVGSLTVCHSNATKYKEAR